MPLVSTVNNFADFFTKALKPGSFTSMRNTIMDIKSTRMWLRLRGGAEICSVYAAHYY